MWDLKLPYLIPPSFLVCSLLYIILYGMQGPESRDKKDSISSNETTPLLKSQESTEPSSLCAKIKKKC